MGRLIRNGSRGFTLLELLIVVMIIGLLVSMGIFTFRSSVQQIRFRNDARGLSQAIQLARLRAISTGIPHGVAFMRWLPEDVETDSYMVFRDCVSGQRLESNGLIGDSHPVPDNMCNNALGYDPRIRDLPIQVFADKRTTWGPVLGAMTHEAPDGSQNLYIEFNTVGQAVQGPNLATPVSGTVSEIIIERTINNVTYQTGVTLIPGTGLSYTIPMRRK